MNSFFPDEPLAKCLQLGEPHDFTEQVVTDAIRDQCSFVALNTATNELVGFCLNEIRGKNDVKDSTYQFGENVNYILRLLDRMHDKIDLFKELNAEVLLHIFMVNVNKTHRCNGLASQLILASMNYVKSNHIGGIYAEATGIRSIRCFKQLGLRTFYHMNYVEYDPRRLAGMADISEERCELVAMKV